MTDDKFKKHQLDQYVASRISRRRFMGTLAAAGASATVIDALLASSANAQTPKKGGRLAVGIIAAQAKDSLDPTKYYSNSNYLIAFSTNENLVTLDANLKPVPWLATSWEPNANASSWVFNLRKGVTFHDGAPMEAEDVIYSMQRHYRKGTESPGRSFMSQIANIEKLGSHQIRFDLAAPNADFPVVLTDIRIHVTKRDLEDFTGKPPGTGPFKVVEFTPGSRYTFAANKNYWGEGPYVDELEFIGIPDSTARINALIAGDINVLMQLDQKAVKLIENSGSGYVINAPSGSFLSLAMMMDRAPTSNPDFRLAMKYAVDRQGLVDNVLKGFGMVGNDHPIAPIDPYYNANIPQRKYDPEKARFYIKKAGLENVAIDLYGSDVAGSGALAAAQHVQQSAKSAGINLNIKNPPADSFWSAVWMKQPLITSGWQARPAPDLIFSIAFASKSKWNETVWQNERFEKLLVEARSVTDFAKRKVMYDEMQLMLHEQGGQVTLGFRNYVDAARKNVKGIKPHPTGPLGFYQFQRTAWIDA